jgi:hypothetical protein
MWARKQATGPTTMGYTAASDDVLHTAVSVRETPVTPYRGFAVLPKIGDGSKNAPFEPDFWGTPSPGDRTEHIISGPNRCLVAVDIADDARLSKGRKLCTWAQAQIAFSSLSAANQQRVLDAIGELGEADTTGTLWDIVRRAGRRLDGNFDPDKQLTSGTPNQPGSFLNDTFTDTSGTGLASHTGETGATWTKLSTIAPDGNMVITDANRVRNNAGGNTYSHYAASGAPATAEYDVDATLRSVDYASGRWLGIAARQLTTGSQNDFYWIRNHPSVGGWQFFKEVAGVDTSLGTYTQSLSANTNYVLQLQIRDAAKKLFIDGVERISTADNAITAAGKVAMLTSGGSTSNSNGQHLDEITGTDAVAAATVKKLSALGVG